MPRPVIFHFLDFIRKIIDRKTQKINGKMSCRNLSMRSRRVPFWLRRTSLPSTSSTSEITVLFLSSTTSTGPSQSHIFRPCLVPRIGLDNVLYLTMLKEEMDYSPRKLTPSNPVFGLEGISFFIHLMNYTKQPLKSSRGQPLRPRRGFLEQ